MSCCCGFRSCCGAGLRGRGILEYIGWWSVRSILKSSVSICAPGMSGPVDIRSMINRDGGVLALLLPVSRWHV